MAGESTIERTRSYASGGVTMRAIPRTDGSGGSSGCKARVTPASSATGTTRSRKYDSVSQRSSWLVDRAASGVGPRDITASSYAEVTASPRVGVVTDDRAHRRPAV